MNSSELVQETEIKGVRAPATNEAIDKYFPGAIKGTETEELIFNQLENLGFTDENTLFADSSCPDEICHDDPEEDISSLF